LRRLIVIQSAEVIVVGSWDTNSLGVIRAFGRQGIPVTLVTSDRSRMAGYSRYTASKLICPDPAKFETQFIDFLLDFGKQNEYTQVIVPTGDSNTLAISKYREKLEQFYLLPMPHFEVIEKLVNKKRFYKLLAQMAIPYPRTYFPANISELKVMAQEFCYPYIIKPAFSHLFAKEFHTKCFLISCVEELDKAIEILKNKHLEIMIQEIIPGNDIYMLYAYFDRDSKPIAICGYDKLRQSPPDFGSGTLCKSAWKSTPIDLAIRVLAQIGYHGIAEPEFKRDPRDGEFKLLEINARTSTENRLPAKCGIDIEYIAYLDTIAQPIEKQNPPKENVIWVDEIADFISSFRQIRDGRLAVREWFKSLKGEKVYGWFARDDPIPFFVSLLSVGLAMLKRIVKRLFDAFTPSSSK
jgi:D-aspartate ligase